MELRNKGGMEEGGREVGVMEELTEKSEKGSNEEGMEREAEKMEDSRII